LLWARTLHLLASPKNQNQNFAPIDSLKSGSPIGLTDSVPRDTLKTRADFQVKQDTVQVPKPPHSDSLTQDSVDWVSHAFKYNLQTEAFSLMGGALLKYRGAVLKADSIYLDNKNEFVSASGFPRIQDKDQPEIYGYRLRYSHKRKIGEMYFGSTKRESQTFNGVEIRRQLDGEIYISRGDFSSCDLPDQHFYFYSRRMALEPNKGVLARPVVFSLGGVPVALAPMVVVPLGKGRRSGFLKPKLGGDQLNGFYIKNLGYYWAINDYFDFQTIADLVEGPKGTFSDANISGNIQYKKRVWLDGNLSAKSYLKEFNPDQSGWEINFRHSQRLTADGQKTLQGEGRLVSSSSILKNALNMEQAIEQTANASFGYTQQFNWKRARLGITGYQNLNMVKERKEWELPRINFGFDSPLYEPEFNDYWDVNDQAQDLTSWYEKWHYSVNTEASVFRIEDPQNPQEKLDSLTFLGSRTQLGLRGKYSLLDAINFSPAANYSHYWSAQEYASINGEFKEGGTFPDNLGRNLHKAQGSLTVDTKLYGIAEPQWGRLQKARHVISPSLSYIYTPKIEPESLYFAHPKFPVAVGQDLAQTIEFNLGNDFDLKLLSKDTAASSRGKSIDLKILQVGTGLRYNFEAKKRKLGDIPVNMSSEIIPNRNLTLNLNYRPYNDFADLPQRDQITWPMLMSWNTGWRQDLSIKGKMSSGILTDGPLERMPWSAHLNYSLGIGATRVSESVFRRQTTQSLGAGAKFNPTPRWDLGYSTAYDFKEGKFSVHTFKINRTLHCWKMSFNWTPVGVSQSWDFSIEIIDMPDIKIESGHNSFQRNRRTR